MAVRFVPLTCAAGLMTPHTLDHNAAQGSWGVSPCLCARTPGRLSKPRCPPLTESWAGASAYLPSDRL